VGVYAVYTVYAILLPVDEDKDLPGPAGTAPGRLR